MNRKTDFPDVLKQKCKTNPVMNTHTNTELVNVTSRDGVHFTIVKQRQTHVGHFNALNPISHTHTHTHTDY